MSIENIDFEIVEDNTSVAPSHLFSRNGRNGANYEIWTEDAVHEVLDDLETYLNSYQEIEYFDKKTEQVRIIRGRPNLFYNKFLQERGLYRSWISFVSEKFVSVSERMRDIDAIQAEKISEGAIFGDLKENFSKFFLMAKHGYSERLTTDNTNKNETLVWSEEKTYINENQNEDAD